MAVTVSTVYAFDMPKYVSVQLLATQGGTVPPTLKIRADKIEKITGENRMVLKLGQDQIGEFTSGYIQGWWIQDE